ncbi:MAG TPA: TonB-dependent receptor [Spongiibacteraceae bacterium]|nr:TonB-dependent receptor [Spongiibacteraceae bacterium]
MLTKKKILSQLIVLAVGGTTSLYSSADAQQDAVTLKKVTVTAQKREETAQEVPTPITVLGGDDLLQAGVGRSATEVVNFVPNASAGTQLHGRPRWWIRGVGTGVQSIDSPNPVGIYFDDVYISNASATGGPLFDIDRVEVLRGPQGTLWGKNTTGGAINFVSKKPSFTPDGYLKLDYGTYDDKTIEGAFGGPIRGEQLAARGSFHHESRDGRFNNLHTGQEDGSFDDSDFRLQFLGEITQDLEALLNLHTRHYTTDGTTSTVTGTGVNGAYRNGFIPSTSIDDVNTNAEDSLDQTQNGVSLNIKWQLGALALTSITAYEDYTNEAFTDSDYTPLELGRSRRDETSRQVSQEFRLTSPREERWNWLAGLHYLHENVDSDYASAKLNNLTPTPPTAPPASYSDANYTHKTKSFAVFGSTTYNFTDDLNVTAGLRWTTENKKLDFKRIASSGAITFNDPSAWWNSNNVQTTFGVPVALDEDKDWHAVTYDLTPEYKITDNARVYFRYAKGFRSGGYNTGATAQAALSKIVDPEYLTSYELGAKSEWLEGRLNANASVFKYNYDDIQVNVVTPLPSSGGTAVSYLQNVKHGKASGAEFDIEVLPIQALHINASLGILNTKFTDFDVPSAGGTVSYSGNRFVRSPHYTGVLGADYHFALPGGGKLVAGSDLKYQSKQYFFTTNQNDPLLGQGAYSIVNARLSYVTADDKVTVTTYANNVGDKVYKNHALPGFQGATGDTSIWGDPRTVGISLTTRW